ncbi:MAG: hypothetical protein WBC22_05355 [Sedimentisphaerales bacterium]
MKKRDDTLERQLLVAILIIVCVLGLLWLGINWVKLNEYRILCASNLSKLGKALQLYANDYDGRYPSADRWCDLLVKYKSVNKRKLICKSADSGMYSTTDPIDEVNFAPEAVFHYEYNDVNGQHLFAYSVEWCHYAINTNARPNSPGDMVLLFETRRGWNQFGGPEILSDENHLDEDRKGCNVLFNDGNVKFIKPKNLKKLKFKD